MKGERKILIVDSDKDFVDALGKKLASSNCRIWWAHNGEEGLDILRRINIDLIITEAYIMDGMDSFRLLKEVKKNEEFLKIPFVVFTERKSMRDSFEMLGVEGFFEKSHSLEEFVDNIEDILSRRVLIVGTDTSLLQGMVKNFTSNNYTPEIISRIDDFEESIKQHKYTLIILPFVFEGNEANVYLEMIRKSEKNKNTPVVIFTLEKGGDRDMKFFSKINEFREKNSHLSPFVVMENEFSHYELINAAKKFIKVN